MEFETFSGASLPKIGFGTARLGGRIVPNRLRERHWMSVIRSAIDLGYRHIDSAELYALGYSEVLIGRALSTSGIDRAEFTLTTKAWPVHLGYKQLMRACEGSLRRLATEYIDLYLIHLPNPFIDLQETFTALDRLASQGKIRHVGVSNFNLPLLDKARSLSQAPILTNQIPYSLHNRGYARSGVVEYCRQNGILVTAYSPLRIGRTQGHPAVRAIAEAHGASPHQVALAWLVSQPHVITIPFSRDPRHQRENLAAARLALTPEETSRLTNLQSGMNG